MKKLTTLLFWILIIQKINAQSFTNPILAGFYPDPSICKAGNDYYLVNSSFAYYPGLPIFHSNDLLNWKQIGHALNRPEQLNLDGTGVSRGLFAPAITYHKGTFYIVCTLVDKLGNFVITTNDPKSNNWSNPVALPQINGIDPSLFFDDNDSAYIVYNSIPPNNVSVHDGHRTIRINSFDAQHLKVTSDNKIIVNGGTDMAKKPVWIEGPHLLKKDGWYYLICAEGGTSENHSEVVFKTKSLNEPFISYDKNPILTQRHLAANRQNPITSTGHADFVKDNNGKWWAVFLGCRPYAADYYNTGRETFMAPVEWKDGWCTINLGGDEVKYSYPIHATKNNKAEQFSGNFLFKDEFDKSQLNYRYQFLRTVKNNWYNIEKGNLKIQLQAATCEGKLNPSFIGFRQSHLSGYAATSLQFTAKDSNEKAGLLVFQNEKQYYFICKSKINNSNVVQLYKGSGKENEPPVLITSTLLKAKNNLQPIQLKIIADKHRYSFYFATKKNNWQLLSANLDATTLSTKVAGGFVGSFYAMYATSSGMLSTNNATYNWFESKNEDEVYK